MDSIQLVFTESGWENDGWVADEYGEWQLNGD
jgi:hypothetical protein